jgi:D-beta-D-heptose 7-phosphate kinase/D-beta-D-heptose 1-phosphate adenosyltransferase
MLNSKGLTINERASVVYHNLFDYPLNFSDLIKWTTGKQILSNDSNVSVVNKRGFYFIEGRDGLVYKRVLRKRISAKKIKIAKNTAKILSFIPTLKMIGITGSLAMQNSSEDSDIDLMIVAKSGNLWTTRLFCYMTTWLNGFAVRIPEDKVQKNKLCLNIWLDESDLIWKQKDRNVYTAHEIAQIIPLIDKDNTFERLLFQNKWILDYWPRAVKIKNIKFETKKPTSGLIEKFCYWLQYQYMRNKITREVITPTRALFHPQDWAKVVLGRLSS